MHLFISFVCCALTLSVAMASSDDYEEGKESQTKDEDAEMKEMIEKVQNQGKYVILTQEEFEKLNSLKPFDSSTPRPRIRLPGRIEEMLSHTDQGVKPKVKLRSSGDFGIRFQFPTPRPALKKPSETDSLNKGLNDTSVINTISQEIPKLPIFSGDDSVKNEVSYEVWRYEVRCLKVDGLLSEANVLQAIRKSLRGAARETLIPLGEEATSDSMIAKLDTLFGHVRSNESVMQNFYSATQREGETVTAFGCRLESMLQVAIQNGHISISARDDMLRSKFWTGLRSEKLKSQTRHKYDNILSYELLLREIRAVDMEINPEGQKVTKAQHKPMQTDTVQAMNEKSVIDKLSEQMNSMMNKLKELERNMTSYSTGTYDTCFAGNQRRPYRQFRGGYRGHGGDRGRGQQFDRGRGQQFDRGRGPRPDRGRGSSRSSFSDSQPRNQKDLNG